MPLPFLGVGLIVLALAPVGLRTVAAANTQVTVPDGTTDLTSLGVNATTDLTFSGTYTTSTTFTVGNGATLNTGSLDDLSATALTIQNGTDNTVSTLALNLGSNAVAPNANDLLYVAAGGALTINGTTGAFSGLNLNLAASGNFDIVGSATVNSVISGAQSITKTGAGTLTVNPSFTAAVTNASGSTTLTLATGASTVVVGQTVSGTGITNGTRVTAVGVSGGTTTITLSAGTTAAATSATFAGNTYSGGTTLTGGTVSLSQTALGGVNGTTVTSGLFGTGNVTINGNVTLTTGGQVNNLTAPQFNILSDFAITETALSGNRIAVSGTFDMGGATRVVTLNKPSTSVGSGGEALAIGVAAGTGLTPVFQNGTIDFEAGAGTSAAQPAVVRVLTTTNFTNNSGLIVGQNVILTQNVFGTSTNAPRLTLNGLFYSGAGTISRSTTVYSLAGAAGSLFTNAVTNAGSATLTISGASGSTTFAGSINDAASQTLLGAAGANGVIALAKTGASTQILSGTSTYSGATTVSGGGALIIDGTKSGAGAVGVTGTGTLLGGVGSIAGAVTIGSGANITGAANGTVGALTLNNTLSLSSGSIFLVDISGATSDRLNFLNTGSLTITAGANLTFNGTPDGTTTYTLANNYTAETGTFNATNLPAGYSLNYGANALTLAPTPVPEPTTVLGGCLLMGLAAWRERRRLTQAWTALVG